MASIICGDGRGKHRWCFDLSMSLKEESWDQFFHESFNPSHARSFNINKAVAGKMSWTPFHWRGHSLAFRKLGHKTTWARIPGSVASKVYQGIKRLDTVESTSRQGHMYVRRVPHGAHLGIFHDLVEPLDQVVQIKLGQVLGDARPGNAAPQALPLLMKAQSIELSRLCTVALSPQIVKGRWERNTSNQQLLQNTSCSLVLNTSCIGNTPFVGKFKYHHGWYLINLRKYLSYYFCHCWWLITSNRFCCVDHLWLVLVSFPSFADRPFWHFYGSCSGWLHITFSSYLSILAGSRADHIPISYLSRSHLIVLIRPPLIDCSPNFS